MDMRKGQICSNLGKQDADNQDKEEGDNAEGRGFFKVDHENTGQNKGEESRHLDDSPPS